MDIEILNKSGNELNFVLKDVNHVIANTLRRVILTEVPVLAMDEITFVKNSSALYDEMLANRLGLIPLKTDLKSYNLPEKCTCKGKGCPKCQLVLTLKAKGPSTVYASDIKSTDPKVEPVYPKTPIVKLLKDQEIELEAIAILGQGKVHSKFSPGLIYYKAYPKIKIDKALKNPETTMKSCPVDVFEVKDKTLKIKNLLNCHLCMACVEKSDPVGSVQVEGSDKDFVFYIESWGQLTPKEMLNASLDILDEKLDEFSEKLKKA